ncbi:MFS transporter [Elizabethkingia occulta]|uniref:MFS transporter n=1 Tax=Elizabethkingia occulta TaxID=1867263 RepID=UPI00099A7772|nr:MFS transporter [Elizabethkingia occulta]OPB95400.1 MFS transporter [Elizabethkingia occulta]
MQQTWLKRFMLIWIGQFISLISSSAVNFAIIIWLSLETRSAEVLAYAVIAGMLPQAILGPIAGVYVDRWNKKITMMLADSFVAVCTLIMSVCFYLGYESFTMIFIVLSLRSIGSAFHMPSMQAAIPMIAPKSQLLRIAGVNQIIQSVSGIAGPALGALSISFFSIGKVLLFDIVGAAIAVISLAFIKIPETNNYKKAKTGIRNVIQDMKTGFNAIRSNKGLYMLFGVSVMSALFVIPTIPLLPLITINHFNGGKFEMGLVEILWSIGMLVGSGVLSIWKPSVNKIFIINIMNIITGILLAWSGLLPSTAFLIFIFLMGMCGAAYSVESATFTTIVQEKVNPEVLGRVFSMYFSLILLPSMIGLFSTGFLVEAIGINQAFIVLGILTAIVGGLSFMIPTLMALDKKDAKVMEANNL